MNIFVGTVTNDRTILKRILLASDLPGIIVHSVSADSATDGLNRLLDQSEIKGSDVSVLCHHDTYFPPTWVKTLEKRLNELPNTWIVAGFFGMDESGEYCGKIHDRRCPLPMVTPKPLPSKALSVDACCFVINTKSDFRFEYMPGFHLYDTYAVLRAREMGGTAWIIDCMPEHYSQRSFAWTPDEEFLQVWAWLKRRFPNERVISTCYRG